MEGPGTAGQLDWEAFTRADFESESAWLNKVLAQTSAKNDDEPSLSELDTTLARTLAALEVATHDTSALVDRTIDEIARSVPRLTFDLQLMRENALLLRFTLEAIKTKSFGGQGTDSEVAVVMEKLKVLDLVKSRMEAARDVLREAESWSTLESEVTALVGEQAYAKAAERLEEAARSMVVFHNTAEYEGRRALMVSLQNQLEASLSAPLVAAINSRDTKACKSFYSIFQQIQREAEFTAYYFGSRRSSLVETWSSALLTDCSDSSSSPFSTSPNPTLPLTPPSKFVPFLSKFYGDLHALLSEERTYVPVIFPSALSTLSSFIQTTLEGLSPSLPHRLSAIAEFHGPLVLPELIQAYKATEEFALVVDRIMNSFSRSESPPPSSPASGPPATPTTPTVKKDRRLSKRMSMSKRHNMSRSVSFGSSTGGPPPGLFGGADGGGGEGEEYIVPPWETAIFEPFLDWQVEYPDLERSYMKAAIHRETKGVNVMEQLVSGKVERGAKMLWELSQTVFGLAEDAVARSIVLTHGYGSKALVDVVDAQLTEFMDTRRFELIRARQGGVKSERAKRGDLHDEGQDEDEAALEGLEYSTEDWSAFQFGLRLLETCRSITEKHTAFETRLRTRLVGVARTIKAARTDVVGYVVPGTTRGATTLLRQSTLNSAALAAFLDPLESPLGVSSLDSPHVATSFPPSPHLHHLPAPPPPPTPLILLSKSRHATAEFTRATQLFLHETILAPLLAHFTEYVSLPVWTTSPDQRPGGKGAFDLSIPTFSLSPTETISRVGEGLFNLPRLFEVYANDDALSFSIETLPFVDAESLRALQIPLPSPPIPFNTPTTPRPSHRLSFSEQVVLPSPNRKPPPLAPPMTTTRSTSSTMSRTTSFAPLSAETVIATWLSSLTLSVLSHLTVTVLPSINRLSKHGAAQLASDLSYIANVARALDVDTPEDLDSWKEAVEVDGKVDEESTIDRAVLEKVARARGVRKF